ncbi:MAG: hypothetical protein KKC68_08040, partial [Candidatus Thermoplasmatota archaeon]|nr:hypothetical protein [Candidatus Thermoplasmatota archaeon]MBU1941708.1 hypothetical protein [Candidatus Thermoplasmatota archaeon]
PSSAVERAEDDIGIGVNMIISDIYTPKEISLSIADLFWENTAGALLIEESQEGYNLGVAATPLASYLNIPVIVTDIVDIEVTAILDELGVQHLFVCGDLNTTGYNTTQYTSIDAILSDMITLIEMKFGEPVTYITMTNPLDITTPETYDSTSTEFTGSVASGLVLPTQALSTALKGNQMVAHEFEVPESYKFARIILDVVNMNPGNVDDLGDRLSCMISSPNGPRYMFGTTGGGIPVRDADGNLLEDRLHYELTIYDEPGTFKIQLYGQWFADKAGDYFVRVTIENLSNAIIPTMPNLSTMTPYLTAYHKGIIWAKPEFAFAADDTVFNNGSTCPGVSQPGTNPLLVHPSNNHTMDIHDALNDVLADIADIPVENLEELRNHYRDNPIHIAIAADPTMIPMYYYYNPDGRLDTSSYMFGFMLPSDFIYGDIDVNHSDPENNTFSYWPFMENAVGRVTGWDAQDCSALIARTIFYDIIIDGRGNWKNNALIQTGCGLEFQNLPIITRLGKILYSQGRDEPTKFPTGESWFINERLKKQVETGEFDAKNTFWLTSQRAGFTKEGLTKIKKAGVLNRLLFPSLYIYLLSNEKKVTGGQDQLNSNFIFAFAHGSYNLYEFGDIWIDTKGFPFITPLSRIIPSIRSGLSTKGSFDIRGVESMEYGPSIIFVESCITGRTDGIVGTNCLSQAYLHAGVNGYIGATRVTADPGYLEPRPFKGGLGFGLLGLLNATLHLKLKGEYPDLHFGAVIAEDFVLDLINDNTTGMALRNAKNQYLPKDANTTFLWTPPLTFNSGDSIVNAEFLKFINGIRDENDRTRTLDKKYVALHEFTLYGDPAFNPYQPINEG